MRTTTLLLAFIFSSIIYAQSYSGPESVEWDAANNRWLISNTTSHAILARTQSGTLSTFVASVGSSGPHGIEILGNVLYACCGSSIKGYDLTSGSQVFTMNLGANFLNGLTTDGDSVLYATDFGNKDIFRINPTTNEYYTLSSNTVTTPNGILYDGANNRCIFVNWGTNAPIKAIDLTSYAITTITTTTLGNCDGITVDHLGYYYVAAWGNNRMNRFNSTFTGGHTEMNSFILSNPADIDCKFDVTDTIGVPNAGDNTCTFIPLAPPVVSFTISDSVICLGDDATYTNTSINADSFVWTFGGGSPGSGSTSPTNSTYDTLGLYTTTLTATNVYGTTTSTHSVMVVAGPAPGITQMGNVLSTTGSFTTYQWYLDGVPVTDSISQSITITTGGDYYVVVTDGSGCSGTSNVISSSLGFDNELNIKTKVFPNPASEMLTVELMLPDPQNIQYNIVNMQGRVLRSATEIFEYQGLNYIIIDLDGLSNGTYILQLNAENISVNKRFIVNK